jgi:hypothetical protein
VQAIISEGAGRKIEGGRMKEIDIGSAADELIEKMATMTTE